MAKKFIPPEICPVCGEDVPRNARACPECGADERSGWKDDDSAHDGLGIADDDFDYKEFVEKEFGADKSSPRLPVLWIIVAVVLIVAFLLLCANNFR